MMMMRRSSDNIKSFWQIKTLMTIEMAVTFQGNQHVNRDVFRSCLSYSYIWRYPMSCGDI